MGTQITKAKNGEKTPEVLSIAKEEGVSTSFLMEQITKGRVVILKNSHRSHIKSTGIGEGLTCKMNVNIGTSSQGSSLKQELEKCKLAHQLGADAIMDLSTSNHLDVIRRELLDNSLIPFGAVPIYQILEEAKSIKNITKELILSVIEKQAKDGVDFLTIHSGVTKSLSLEMDNREMGVVSRGGAIICKWMDVHGRENPFLTYFDDILSICYQHDVTISLGDGLRPGCIDDASDRLQLGELKVLGECVRKARKSEVQVMVEGPGHIPFDQIDFNIKIAKYLCEHAPFYVLGPLVTDIAPGYDHITGAIGATQAGYCGADFLCYLTPKEHLGLPELADVREGIIAFKIATHAVNLARGFQSNKKLDTQMARARKSFRWEDQFKLSLDPSKSRELFYKDKNNRKRANFCSMCGPEFCSMREGG